MAGFVGETTDASFQNDVLDSDIPVLVDFWAPWCGPCKSIAPIIDELAEQYQGKLKVVKVNVDDNPRSPAQYQIRGIPNLVFFKGGKVVGQVFGSVPKDQIEAEINKLV